jgi:Zinc knuckle
MVNQVHGPQGTNSTTATAEEDRRFTLLERADLDSDSNGDEDLLGSAEYKHMVQEEPEQFLKEIRELIKQQRALNLAHADLIDKHADLKERTAHLEDKIKAKDRTIAHFAEEALTSGRERSASPYNDTPKLAKIADPPFFANKPEEDKLSFDGWLIQVRNKLTSDERQFPTEHRKIIYVTGLLRSPAYDLISPRLDQSNPIAYTTIAELYEHMQELWSNPNKQRDARSAFRKLVMEKGVKFQEFYAEFSRLVAEGHIAAQDLKDELYTKLWWKLQESVAVYYNDSDYSLHRFSTMCAVVDRQIRERLDKTPQASEKPKTPTATTKDTPKPTTRHTLEVGGQTKTAETDAAPKPTMTCYNCRKPGHMARKCPKPMTSQRKRFSSNVVKELADAESGNDDL